jgi:hypothetical protein
MLLRFYKTPPAYDAKLASTTVSLMPPVLLVHMLLSTWVYSSADVFQSTCIEQAAEFDEYLMTANEYDPLGAVPRLLKRNTAPMFAVTIVVLMLVLYSYLGHWIVKMVVGTALNGVFAIVLWPFRKLYRCCCGETIHLEKEFNPPFSKDFVRGYPKGISVPNLAHGAGWIKEKNDDGYVTRRERSEREDHQAALRRKRAHLGEREDHQAALRRKRAHLGEREDHQAALRRKRAHLGSLSERKESACFCSSSRRAQRRNVLLRLLSPDSPHAAGELGMGCCFARGLSGGDPLNPQYCRRDRTCAWPLARTAAHAQQTNPHR